MKGNFTGQCNWIGDEQLHDGEFRLLTLLNLRSRKNGYCWATNEHISKVLNKKQRAVKPFISVRI